MYQSSKSGTHHLCGSISSPSILKKCGKQSLNNLPGKKVRFDLFNNIKLMLINYDKDRIYYNNLICDIRDSTSEITVSCVNILNILKNAINLILPILFSYYISNWIIHILHDLILLLMKQKMFIIVRYLKR